MVVSVDITGVLEERLRKLVELGLYASVAEAVREGVRKLLKDLDMRKIALQLYTSKNVTFHYTCYFSDTPCDLMIDYFLENEVVPLLGAIEINYELTEINNRQLILDPSSLYTLYSSNLPKVANKFLDLGYTFYIPKTLKNYQDVLQAKALVKNKINSLVSIRQTNNCGGKNINEKHIIMSDAEKEAIKTALGCGYLLVSEDIRLRAFAKQYNIKTISWTELLFHYKDYIGDTELADLLVSLKSIPILIPPQLEERIRT